MISVVIPTLDDEERLAATLAALVAAAAEGIVREVVVADGGSADQTRRIADGTGCTVVDTAGPAGARAAAGAAASTRGEFLLVLRPGVILDVRWEAEAATFVDRVARAGLADRRAGVFRFDVDDLGAGAGLRRSAVALAGRLTGRPHPSQPLLVSRALYRAVGGHAPLEAGENADLARRIGRSRLVRLRTAAWMTATRRD
jgi:glycosyltransferase involved in cell wall biosynthesis